MEELDVHPAKTRYKELVEVAGGKSGNMRENRVSGYWEDLCAFSRFLNLAPFVEKNTSDRRSSWRDSHHLLKNGMVD